MVDAFSFPKRRSIVSSILSQSLILSLIIVIILSLILSHIITQSPPTLNICFTLSDGWKRSRRNAYRISISLWEPTVIVYPDIGKNVWIIDDQKASRTITYLFRLFMYSPTVTIAWKHDVSPSSVGTVLLPALQGNKNRTKRSDFKFKFVIQNCIKQSLNRFGCGWLAQLGY